MHAPATHACLYQDNVASLKRQFEDEVSAIRGAAEDALLADRAQAEAVIEGLRSALARAEVRHGMAELLGFRVWAHGQGLD